MPLTKIQSLGITDGTIVNADINASAAIAGTKLSGAGKVLQVVSTHKNDDFTSASGSFVDVTGLSVSITPSSASNKILILSNTSFGSDNIGAFKLIRNSTGIAIGDAAGSRQQASAVVYPASGNAIITASFNFLDSPNTTSATTYKIQMVAHSVTGYVNRNNNNTDQDAAGDSRIASTITVMEIAA